jgi:GTP-binding protein
MSPVSPLRMTFLQSASRVEQLPDATAEVAFVGRSNVGKSTLINALAERRHLAHVSKTPGRTRLINCFDVAGVGTLVDLPGYGYAKAPMRDRARWQQMIEGYLLERQNLRMIAVLVDGEIGPTVLDLEMLDWLRSRGLPHTVVATKHDKVKSSGRDKRKRELASKCMLEPIDPVWVSAAKGTGIERLRGLLLTWLS